LRNGRTFCIALEQCGPISQKEEGVIFVNCRQVGETRGAGKLVVLSENITIMPTGAFKTPLTLPTKYMLLNTVKLMTPVL